VRVFLKKEAGPFFELEVDEEAEGGKEGEREGGREGGWVRCLRGGGDTPLLPVGRREGGRGR